MSVELRPCAFSKVLLHGAKYPAQAVGGFLVGKSEGGKVQILDAFLVYHGNPVGPIFEVASSLFQEHYCSSSSSSKSSSNDLAGVEIVGVYFAQESLRASGTGQVPAFIETLLEFVKSRNGNGTALLLELNGKLINDPSPETLCLVLRKEGSNGGESLATPKNITNAKLNELADKLLANGKHRTVVDVDDHMEGSSTDCRNAHIDAAVASLL